MGGHHVRYENPLHDKVMVFFREKAEEFQPYRYGLASSPSTRYVVSRVATVCVVSSVLFSHTLSYARSVCANTSNIKFTKNQGLKPMRRVEKLVDSATLPKQ